MPGSPLDDLPGWALELLRGARVARLGLIDEHDRPRVLPVTFALAGGAVWSAMDHKRKQRPGGELARVRFLRRRPEVALTADRWDEDWSGLAWVQVLGRVEVLDDAGDGAAALEAKYPQYRERPPAGPFLRLEPARCLSWRG